MRTPLKVLTALVVACAGAAGIRYATFDPQAFAASIRDQVSYVTPDSVKKLHHVAQAKSFSSAVDAVGSMHVSAMLTRMHRVEANYAELRARFHRGPGPCARYPDDTIPRNAKAAADAIAAAGLSSRLDGVEKAAARLWVEEDNKAHAAPRAQELVEFFGERAGLWQRLGLAMHKRAVEADLAVLPANRRANVADGLSQDERAAVQKLVAHYGASALIQGTLVLGERIYRGRGARALRAP